MSGRTVQVDERGGRLMASAVSTVSVAARAREAEAEVQGCVEVQGRVEEEVGSLRLFGGAAVVRAVRECSQGLMSAQAPRMSVDEVRGIS